MKNNGKKEGEKLLLEGILNLEMLCMPYERFTYNDLLRSWRWIILRDMRSCCP